LSRIVATGNAYNSAWSAAGHLDELQKSGELERVVRQLVEQCPTVRIMQAEAQGGLEVQDDKTWGPVRA
jgi:hypothetical protein